MADHTDDSRSPQDIIEELRVSLSNMRQKSLFLKFHKDAQAYDKFTLALEQADFYLEHFEVDQANAEIDNAIDIIK